MWIERLKCLSRLLSLQTICQRFVRFFFVFITLFFCLIFDSISLWAGIWLISSIYLFFPFCFFCNSFDLMEFHWFSNKTKKTAIVNNYQIEVFVSSFHRLQKVCTVHFFVETVWTKNQKEMKETFNEKFNLNGIQTHSHGSDQLVIWSEPIPCERFLEMKTPKMVFDNDLFGWTWRMCVHQQPAAATAEQKPCFFPLYIFPFHLSVFGCW